VSGRIVDKNGSVLQPELTIPPTASGVQITSDGTVNVINDPTQPPQAIGQIELVNFVNAAGLKSIGKNLFVQTPASGQAINSRPGLQGTGFLAQGQLEGSNVNIAEEMVSMITAQRLYETNSKAIQAADQMLQTINNMR
jgi:flagellar basal-body rod protein FlgG